MTFKNGVQTNRDGGFILCPMVLKYSILTFINMTKMLIYFVLTLMVSFIRNRQLKTSNFEKIFTFPDGWTDGRTESGTDGLFFF